MKREKISKFFKVHYGKQHYKVFLSDVSAIYKFQRKNTPPLTTYEDASNVHNEDEQPKDQTRRERLVDSKNVGWYKYDAFFYSHTFYWLSSKYWCHKNPPEKYQR